MQLTSWNCRGLGNSKKAEDVKDLLRMEPSEILLLQETKIDQDSLLILSKNKWKLNSGIVVSARGTCGGLPTIWLEDKYTLLSSFATPNIGSTQSFFALLVGLLFPSLICMYL